MTALAARIAAIVAMSIGAVAAPGVAVADGELNLYSSRHYDTDERLYTDFEEQTGIKVNRIEGKASELIERLVAEGVNSPADILITVDAGRIGSAKTKGLFQEIESETLDLRIPSHLRDPEGHWYGFSQRARIIFYDPEQVPTPPTTYESLADPMYKDMVCARSSSNVYMISLMSSMIEAHGAEDAKKWAQGLYDNFARKPQGGDTDQLRGIVSGECAIALANSYYFARALRKDVKDLSADIEKISWVFPNQSDRGAHVNISAAGVAKHAPNKENAIKFLEYLTSDSAQEYFSNGNDEYPTVPGVGLSEAVGKLGLFRSDTLNLEAFHRNAAEATSLYDEVGYP
ncbi:MAG: Fe(3+) ABC transporter substrate-binding protein [Rhodobacteraceae bacterium]|nr:Fe(3+) ABC transporter substrate-binding protein [Paracoccaceae bacterium]